MSRNGEALGDHIVLEPIEVTKAATPPPIEALGIQVRREVDFGPVRLLGYSLSKLGYEHQPDEPVHAGDTLHLTLFWQALAEIDADFALTLQLQDQLGNVVVSRDVRPTGGAHPLTSWEQGEMVRDQHHLLLPVGQRAGKYDLFLRVDGLEVERGPLLLTSLQI